MSHNEYEQLTAYLSWIIQYSRHEELENKCWPAEKLAGDLSEPRQLLSAGLRGNLKLNLC